MISIYDSTFLLVYTIVLAFVLGACMGSFLNCAAMRTGREESFIRGRSHCMSCGHDLGFVDLVPVASWVLLKGKCRYCGAKVSGRYPLSEIVFALVCVGCLLKFDLTVLGLRNFIFLSVLFYLTITDLETMRIPDGCHVIAALAWILSAPMLYPGKEILIRIAVGAAVGAGLLGLSLIMDRVMGRDTLGGGDIKLFAVIGLYFGAVGTLFTLVLSCIIGLGANAIMKKREFPFGPWIAAASALMLFFGEPLIRWYSGLLV